MQVEIWHIWMFAAIFLFVIEIIMTQFIALCIGIGTLLAGVGTYLGMNMPQQLLIFASFTLFNLFLVLPLVQKIIFKTKNFIQTSAHNLLGRQGTVVENIEPHRLLGRVEIDGYKWKAVSINGQLIPKGKVVKIINCDRVVLTVK